MAQGLPSVLVENAELVGTVAVIVSSFIYRYFGGEWPLLSKIRRNVLPFLHEFVLKPAGGYAAREQYEREYVGSYNVSLKELHKVFRKAEHVYPNNFASIKYREKQSNDGKTVREYESSSWAFREEGLTGKMQTHLMVYTNDTGGVDIYAHHELNPIPNPVKHYEGEVGWSVKKGVDKAVDLMIKLNVEESDVQLRL